MKEIVYETGQDRTESAYPEGALVPLSPTELAAGLAGATLIRMLAEQPLDGPAEIR